MEKRTNILPVPGTEPQPFASSPELTQKHRGGGTVGLHTRRAVMQSSAPPLQTAGVGHTRPKRKLRAAEPPDCEPSEVGKRVGCRQKASSTH
jgi:hypothetical protein